MAAPAVAYAAPAQVVEYFAPTPTVSCAVLVPVTDYIAPARTATDAALAQCRFQWSTCACSLLRSASY